MGGIRAAKIENGVVTYFTTPEDNVTEFNDYLIDPKDAVLGSTWDGEKFNPPVPTPPSIEEYQDAVQRHLDDAARAKNYDDIVSACSYAGAPNPFQAEGQAFLTWRGNVWATCYQIMADVQAGRRTAPTVDGLIAELPALQL
jgi:hypothetical protein